ncbi:MAG: DUF4124 domain-containing protein [Syntrophaceae bacterium]|nr:DUF4124 domain-containing protein [Syntrophaceae bacterium]
MRLLSKRLFSLAVAVLILGLPEASPAQTYKYVDENGSVYFVDSLDKIPPPYRKNTKVIQGIGRDEKVPQKPNPPIPEQSLIGRWEHQGVENGNSYTVIMTLRPKGVFDGNGYKKMGEKTFVWMFKGNWKLLDGDLALTYTWSSASEPKRGSTLLDTILEVNDQFLELKSGRTGEVYRYVRK